MDILRFVNSKDIRKHLARIGYEFNSLEAAWLIYQCRDVAIEEKQKAWRELIATMPDCPMPDRKHGPRSMSLHEFLRRYIAVQNACMEQFREDNHGDMYAADKPYVYLFGFRLKNGSRQDYNDAVCSSYSSLCEIIRRELKEYSNDDVVSIRCRKAQLDATAVEYEAVLTPELNMMEIRQWGLDHEDADIYYAVFDDLWFDFPTPFNRGDIVWNPRRPEGYCAGPFVVTGVCLDGIESERVKENIRQYGDVTDMCARGYFQDPDGGIYYEDMYNYMDLEFCDKVLIGTSRTLIPLSSYLKEKIDAGLLARAYHQIMTEGYAEGCRPLDITKAGLVLAGLEQAAHIRIWLDDVQEAPKGYHRCKSVNEAKRLIEACEEEETVIDVIDCDHDLGDYADDGGDGIKLLDWLAYRGTFYPIKLHAMNPVGCENMQREIDRYWNDE